MRILFVWPTYINPIFKESESEQNLFYRFMSRVLSPSKPLTFASLAASTPKKHVIETVAGRPHDIDYDEEYDLVGITCTTPYAFWAYDMADEFRKRGIFVALGGWHPSALPFEAKKHADSVFIGEAEDTWPCLLNDVENGASKPFYEPTKPVDFQNVSSPLNIYSKKNGLPIQATRGCPYGCDFCSITHMKFRNTFRKRAIENVVEEIQLHPNKNLIFYDNSLTIDINYTKQLFKEMEGLNKRFIAMGNINALGEDDEFLRMAYKAGCFAWVSGIESISQDSLRSVSKKTNQVKKYKFAIKKIHEHGMILVGSFVFGFDYDTLDIFDKTNAFVEESEIDVPDVMILTPFPGTPLYDKFNATGRILTKDWSKYDFEHVVFQPKNMTSDDLFTSTRDLYREWYKTSTVMRRVLKSTSFGYRPFRTAPLQNLQMKLWRC